MNAMTDVCTEKETELVREVFQRVASDLAMVADRQLVIESVRTERAAKRPAGRGRIHLSFRLGFRTGATTRQGCLLVPLPDAISLACYLMMIPDDAVRSRRAGNTLEGGVKDAMLEVGNFVGGATDAALRALGWSHVKVLAEGCQGVKPDVRPALRYREGEPLIVGRARAKLHDYPECEMLLALPELPPPIEA
jgi:hypothetical protein